MPARIRVEWRYAYQPMYAVLALEPAIGVVAFDHDGRRLDAGTLALGFLDPFDLITVRFGPAHVHAYEHAGPILALGAASSGMDFEVAIVGVRFSGQQRLQFSPCDFGLQSLQCGFCFGNRLVVLLRLTQIDQRELVVELLLDAADGLELVIQRVTLSHDTLGARLIVPKVGVFGLFVQLGEAPRRGVDIKDASSAAG